MTQEEIDNRHRIFTELLVKFREQENKILRQVMSAILGRAPTMSDTHNFTRVFETGNPNRYVLKHLDNVIGVVTYDFPDLSKNENSYTITFKPV